MTTPEPVTIDVADRAQVERLLETWRAPRAAVTGTFPPEPVIHAAMYRDGIPGTLCRPGWEPMVTPVTADATCPACRFKIDGGGPDDVTRMQTALRSLTPAPPDTRAGVANTLSDAEREELEGIEDSGDTQGLAWKVEQMIAKRATPEPPTRAAHPDAERVAPELAALLADWDWNSEDDNYTKGMAADALRAALRGACPTCQGVTPGGVHNRRCPARLDRLSVERETSLRERVAALRAEMVGLAKAGAPMVARSWVVHKLDALLDGPVPDTRAEGCDCTELCSMGPTCPGGMLARLPGSGCWRTAPAVDEPDTRAEHDATGLISDADCRARHPATGNGCIEPGGHDGLHRAMGAQRLQRFGAEAESAPAPAVAEGTNDPNQEGATS